MDIASIDLVLKILDFVDYLNPFLFKNSQEMVIAKENNNLVGIAGIIYENRERKKHTATLVWFYIDQIYRGKGISKVIMNKILELANNRKIEKISLMVNQNQERAISLYKKYGFIEAGTLKKEIKIDSNYYDVYIMELFLKNL